MMRSDLSAGVTTLIFTITLASLALVSVAIVYQYLRRIWLRRRAAGAEAAAMGELALLMRVLFGPARGADAAGLRDAVGQVSLDVLTNVLRSMRGVERGHLLDAVEHSGRIAPLLRRLEHGGLVARLTALRMLEAYDCPPVAAALARLLERRVPQLVRNTAALVLTRQGVVLRPALLVTALRLEAVRPTLFHRTLLREMGLRDCHEVFALLAMVRNVPMKAALIRALGHDVTLQALPALEQWAAHPEAQARAAAAMAAARLRHPSSLPWVKGLFFDADPTVRLAAVVAFRQIAPAAAAHELSAFTAETEPRVFGAAAAAATAMRRGLPAPRLVEVGA